MTAVIPKPDQPKHTAMVSLSDGHDAATARALVSRFRDAQKAGRRIMSFGLFAWEIKTLRLKHSQWGPWLATHAPELCRRDSKTDQPKPSASLSTYMQMTKDVLEDMGFTIDKYFQHVSNSQQLGICRDGKFLLKDPRKLPEPVRKLHDEFCTRVDGKSAKQIRFAFGQVEEDSTGDVKPKRGRLKGQGGASKAQRDAAAAADAKADRDARNLEADATTKWLLENADAKHAGEFDTARAEKLCEAAEYMAACLKAILAARKSS